MTAALQSSPIPQFFSTTGVPLVAGKLFCYAAGTTTKQVTYTDSTGSSQQTNPIILNNRGEPENQSGASVGLWLSEGVAYKLVLAPSTDTDPPTNPIWTIDNVTGGGLINQPLTTNFFTQNGAVIDRFNDRVLIGGATLNDAAIPNITKDWLSTIQVGWGFTNGSVVSSQAAILSSNQTVTGYALTVGAQSLYATSALTSTIAFASYAVNNNATLANMAWAGYFQANSYYSTSGSTVGVEVDISAFATTTNPTPNNQGSAVGLQIASGGQLPSAGQFTTSCAIQIAPNPSKFNVGINFLNGAVVTNQPSIQIPNGNPIWFMNAGSHLIGAINSTGTGSTGTAINFTDSGFQIANATGGNSIAFFFPLTSAVNYLTFSGATTGNTPFIKVAGSDTNVSGILQGQGTGGWQFLAGGGAVQFQYNNTGIGFFATSPVSKPNVSGSKGGNAALSSLMTALSSLGLVTDSTT